MGAVKVAAVQTKNRTIPYRRSHAEAVKAVKESLAVLCGLAER